MAQIPTPPASRSASESPNESQKPETASSELLQSLDTLLEKYLHLLDRQQELQSGLAKQLSSGFLALAHANYTCPPGRRYGADYYDERMKATRKIAVRMGKHTEAESKEDSTQDSPDSWNCSELNYNFSLEGAPSPPPESSTKEKKADSVAAEESEDASSSHPDTATASSTEDEHSSNSETAVPAPKSARKKFRSSDPIHWYGILTPLSLRNAQTSFTGAVETQVPGLAAVVVEMRAVEDEISQLRKKLGVEDHS
ncbi:hypothetical protein N7474_005411 [Penicillium riverlandense]|uniref:uncharacterized protein n=1 Tax=Penicillium riverlandense TaxID=1903569 RepID=UPI002547E5B1|nr:uncharacterized protein N7474_005411 [Penicillium riverlandense]KAJ5819820.1 hypothetical protein N7474_005411 [Penicillium riverlandense]